MTTRRVASTCTRTERDGTGYTQGVQSRTAAWVIGGRYRVDGLLGEGGMARVFGAFDDRLGRPVAVKLLRAETEELPGMRQRFQQEARIAARLVHPHIVAVLDYGEDGSSSYLVMERLHGTTLRDEIMRGPLSQRRLMLVASETLSALAAAHRRGVLHRDIKPSNILIHDDGHTKITDFGIAKSFDARGRPDRALDDLTMTGVVLGTPGYLAPERRTGCPATVQSDLYSVGAVMLEAATGCRLSAAVGGPETLVPPFRDIVRRALAADPTDRFASADAMLQALHTKPRQPMTITGPPGARTQPMAPVSPTPSRQSPASTARARTAIAPPRLPPPPEPAPSPRRHRGRRRAALLLVALAVLLVALFLVLAYTTQPAGRAAGSSSHHVARTTARQTTTTQAPQDPERTAINTLATSLANGGLPGDRALASSLAATAAEPAGRDREALAQQTLSLAQVLLDGGGITNEQYQEVVSALAPTGATPPTPITVPAPSQPGGLFGSTGPGLGAGSGTGAGTGHGHGHRHQHGLGG
jgi:eukaryotic-like serine/threonine-protein kinase